jgi:hypothetical protein
MPSSPAPQKLPQYRKIQLVGEILTFLNIGGVKMPIFNISGGSGFKSVGYRWSKAEASTIPYNFWGGSAVVFNNEIHILGGTNIYTKHYKWDGSKWASVSTLPCRFDNSSAVVLNNEIHILGEYYTGDWITFHYKWKL